MSATTDLLFFAAQATPLDDLKKVPKQVWINLLICVLGLIVMVRMWRSLKSINEFAPYIAAALGSGLIMFYWVYERAEPKFLTPLVDYIAPLVPTKSYQQKTIERIKNRER